MLRTMSQASTYFTTTWMFTLTREGGKRLYGDLLVSVIFDKLPNLMKTQINREHGDRCWTLPELKDSIYKEIEANQPGEEQGKPTPSTATFLVVS